MTEEQHNALLHLVERAKAQPENKLNDEIRAIASIKVGSVVRINTQFHFTCSEDNEGKWQSEYFDSREECLKSMKATLLESAAEEMTEKTFSNAAISIENDTMTLTMTRDDDTILERKYEMWETVDDK